MTKGRPGLFDTALRALRAPLLRIRLHRAAHATLSVYISQADFVPALGASGVDSFDDLDPTHPLATPLHLTAGSYGYSASVGPNCGFWPASVNAVGGYFFGNDLFGSVTESQTIKVSASDADGSKTISVLNPGKNAFLGFVSSGAMSSLKVWVGVQGSGEEGVWPAINKLTLGHVSAIPEPPSYTLMPAGLGLLGFIARRKKQA